MSNLPNIQPYTVEDMNAGSDPNANLYTNQPGYAFDQSYDPNQTYDPAQYQPEPVNYEFTQTIEQKPKRKIPWFLIFIAAAFILLMIIGFLVLTSGDNPNTNNNNNTTSGNNQEIVLQWWGVFLDKETVQPLIEEYENDNPNVTIEYANKWPTDNYEEAATGYQTELNRVIESQNVVELPDIFMVQNTWAGDYEAYSQPASGVIDIATIQNNFYPAVAKDFANDGLNVYGVPLWMDTFAIVYNKDLLNSINIEEPPENWDRFTNVADALTVFNGNTLQQAGFAAGSVNNTSFFFELSNILLSQNGVVITDDDNSPIFSSDPDSVDALNFLRSFAAGNNATWSADFKNDSSEFLEQDVAMIVAPSWRLREILNLNKQFELGIDIGIAPLPQIEGQSKEFVNWADYWGNMVTLNRPNSSEAWRFLEWMSRPEQLKKLNANVERDQGFFGSLYPRSDMKSELAENTYLSVYNSALPYAETWYMVKGFEIRMLFKEVLTKNLNASILANLEEDIKAQQVLKGIFNNN